LKRAQCLSVGRFGSTSTDNTCCFYIVV